MFRAPKLLTAIKHVFGRGGRVQRKRCSICERLAYKKKVFKRSLLKTGGADDDCSLVDKSDHKEGHLKTILARGGGNLNDPIFKSSKVPPGVGGMLKFRVDRRLSESAAKSVFRFCVRLEIRRSRF